VMLIDRTLTFRSIHDKARMQDPAVVRLRGKVRLVPGGRGAGERAPLLQIAMADGTRLVQDTVGAGPLGTTANPMSRDQVIAKARDLMAPVLGGAQTTRLIERTLGVDSVGNIRELRPLLQRGNRSGAPKLSEYPNVK
jgi:2-methylcitrate dehydratase PrpD